jgi:Holliday junction resolvase RusA-like endonuclease
MSAVEQIMSEATANVLARRGMPWTELHLPIPPSINRRMGNLGNRSPEVQAWFRQADAHYMAVMRTIGPRVLCEFEFDLTIDQTKTGKLDLDNRIKCVLDWLEKRAGLIRNDKDCRKLTVVFGHAPCGCVVRLRPWVSTA